MASDYTLGMIRAFVSVYESRNVSAAAVRLHLSQPTVTYALNGLREALSDPLFTRQGREMIPTELATRFYPRVRAALASLDSTVAEPGSFDPAQSLRTVRIRLTDIGGRVLLPVIVRAFHDIAPHVTVQADTFRRSDAARTLSAGTLDALIGTPVLDEEEFRRDVLFEQHYVGICASDHPRLPQKPTTAVLRAERHAAIAEEAGHYALAGTLASRGFLTPAVSAPSFLILPAVVAGTELVSFIPRVLAADAVIAGCRVFELPFDVPTSSVSLYTQRSALQTPEGEWIRRTIHAALSDFVSLNAGL